MILRAAPHRPLFLLAALLLGTQAYAGEGKDAPAAAKPSAPASDLETVAVIADQAPVKADGKVVATVEKGRMFGVLARRGDEVEVQVCVGAQILRGALALSHVKFLTDADIDLAAEWLKMSKDLNPKMDIAAYRAKLDALLDRVSAAAAVGKTPREKARLIGLQLFEREGFSCAEVFGADRVLDQRQGHCFSLSLLYLCVGKRLGVPFYFVVAPEHAFVRYDGARERFNLETTRRGKGHDLDDYLREHLGAERYAQAGGMDLASLPVPRALGVFVVEAGCARLAMGKYTEACQEFSNAVEINPRMAVAYGNWSMALGRLGKQAEACSVCPAGVEANPRLALTYINWGLALGETGKYADAREKLAKAIEIDPRNAHAYNNWGYVLGRTGKRVEACEKFARAIEMNPRLSEAYVNWGDALVEMGKPAEACQKCSKAIEIDPREAYAYFNWGWALGKMGKTAEAFEKLDKAVALDPALKTEADRLRRESQEGK